MKLSALEREDASTSRQGDEKEDPKYALALHPGQNLWLRMAGFASSLGFAVLTVVLSSVVLTLVVSPPAIIPSARSISESLSLWTCRDICTSNRICLADLLSFYH